MGHRATLEGKIRTTEEAGKDGSVLLSCTYTSMTPFSITFSLPPPLLFLFTLPTLLSSLHLSLTLYFFL